MLDRDARNSLQFSREGMAGMKTVHVQFESSRELLNVYWGFLEDGGLFLDEQAGQGLQESDTILVEVGIATLKKKFLLEARVVRREAGRTVVAFQKDQGQDLLLNAAWADSHDVPQRKHRRFRAAADVRYGASGGPTDTIGHLVGVSHGGCCMRGVSMLPSGSRVSLLMSGAEVSGQVRWATSAGEMGIEFSSTNVPIHLLVAEPFAQL